MTRLRTSSGICAILMSGLAAGVCAAAEPAATRPASLTAEQRVVGFIELWTEVKYNFAFFDHAADLDWEEVRRRYVPRVREEQSDDEYHLLLQECLAQLRDGHTEVMLERPRYCPAVRVQPIEGRVIITEAAPTEEVERAGIRPGLEVTHIGRRPVREILERDIYPYVSASTAQARDRRAWRQLLEGPADSAVTLTVQDVQGVSREVTLPRVDPRHLPWVARGRALVDYKEMGGGILCVSLNSFNAHRVVEEFDRIFEQVGAARGLILDVRENGGGSSGHGYAIIGRLIDKPLKSARWKTRQYLPVLRAWGREQGWHEHGPGTVPPRGDDPYLGPIVVLIGPGTASAAEDFLVPLHAGKRATLVGEKTCGSTGQPLIVDVPGGVKARICAKRDWYPDGREFVGVGIIPDVEVHPTREDVAAGRDVVLERGIEVLERMMRQTADESKVE